MKKFSLAFLMVALCVIGMFLAFPVSSQAATFHKGIYIDGIDMSGKTAEDARQIIQDKVSNVEKANITFTSPTGNSVTVHPSDIGLYWEYGDVINDALNYGVEGNILQRYKAIKDLEVNTVDFQIAHKVSRDAIESLILDHMDEFSKEATDAELVKAEKGFILKGGEPGVKVDEQEAAAEAQTFLCNEWHGGDITVELVAEVDEPLGKDGESVNITDVIGTFTTEYKQSGSARVTNVENGCRLLNDITLYPGEQLSVLEHLVPFNEQNGYKLAGSYMNGLVVDTFGGGICQVSSTLYNAVLLAELQVDVRTNHSMIVDYVPPSGDAAIAETSGKDFKFTNNRDYPIYIEGYTTPEKTITFNIYGIEDRPSNRVVSYTSETLERTVPDYESIVPDASKPIGYTSITSSHAGIKAQFVKTVTVDGVEESREVINKSTYKMVPRTLVVGTGTTNPDAAAQMQAAIDTGSIDQARAVAQSLAAQLAAAAAEQPQAGEP